MSRQARDWKVRSIKDVPTRQQSAENVAMNEDLAGIFADIAEEMHRIGKELSQLRSVMERGGKSSNTRHRRRKQ
jgi:hypothetical protein